MRPGCKSGQFIDAPTATFVPVTARLPNVVTVTAFIEGKLVATKKLRVR